MAKVSLHSLQQQVSQGEKFTCLTAYDATFAELVSSQGVDIILVGDSLGMVVQGHDSTLPVTVEQMAYHTAGVAKGNQGSLIMADMPFMSAHTLEAGLNNASKLMQAGAHLVKLEGGAWLAPLVKALKQNGVPSCLHLGLTPQSVNAFGGYRIQGREQNQAQQLIKDALDLEAAGADLLLLECVPASLAAQVVAEVKIPVIGIGAGSATQGQVLVSYDMLGLGLGRKPRFVKNYLALTDDPYQAVSLFVQEVKQGIFPAEEHQF